MNMSRERRYGLISFDLDGTLVDTAAEITEAVNRAFVGFGLPRQSVHEVTLLIGHGAPALIRELLARLGATVSADDVVPHFQRHYMDTNGRLGLPYPGCLEMLQRLRAAGLRLACVTNKQSRHTQQLLQHHGLAAAFDIVIGGDTLPQKKPHASVLQHVAATQAVAIERVAHVGDSATDVMAARNAGAAAWAVPWGYNGGQPISAAAPDRIFLSLPAVADHVLAESAP